jgi:YVTN family beta-propeller protein
MDLRLLGPIEAVVEDRPVTLGPPKQRAVLAMLALDAGRTVSADRLIDGLWGDKPPASAAKMVQLYVSQLRRVIDGNGAEIVTRGRGYELRIEPQGVDVVRFTRLLEDGRSREALALWRGQALADLDDEPFAAAEIQRLEELRLRATEQAIDADLASGRHADVIAELDRLVAAHPLRERLRAQHMLALYRAGRQSEALEEYREARRVLVEEIGVEPGAELQRLHHAILDQDPALELPRREERVPEEAPAERASAAGLLGSWKLVAVVALAVAVAMLFAALQLGGDDELTQLDENAVGAIDAGNGRITGQYPVGRGAAALAVGGGSVWVANTQDGTVAQLQRGQSEVVTIDVGGEPTGLAFGAGSLWVADGDGRTVAQVDPYARKVVQRFDAGNAAHAVAVGYGAVWATSAVDGTVVRFDLARGEITDRIAVGTRPTAIAAGGRGVWVASDVGASVVHIDPRSRTVVARIPTGNGAGSVAVGAGAVWVANRVDGTVSRVDPATDRVTDTVRVGREPKAITADDRSVWVANGGDGSLARLDPRAVRVVRRVVVGNSPAAVTVADDVVWTAVVPGSSTHRGGRLRVTVAGDPGDTPELIDPSTFDTRASLAYDALVGFRRAGGSAGGALVPNLARELPEPSPDGLTYSFRLRDGLRFSNGRALRLVDVRASIERLLVVGGIGGDGYLPIRGADRCTTRRCDLSTGIALDAVARTVTITLARPDVEFLHKLANAMVVPAGSPLRRAQKPLPGTGPYRIKRWDARAGVLVRNPYFRPPSPDRPDGFPDEITFRRMPPRDQVAAVQRGTADLATFDFTPVEDIVRGRALFGTRLHADSLPQTWFLFMNTRVAPFDDARVRRALNYAIDRGRVAEILGSRETLTPTCQLLPPGFQGYTPSCPFSVAASPAGVWTAPDLAKARALVAASGTRGTEVEVWVSKPWERLGPYVRSVLRRLGYRAAVRTFDDLGQMRGPATTGRRRSLQLGLWGWIADSPGPLNFISPLVSCSGTENFANFCDHKLDAAARDAAAARGPDALEKWRRVQAALASESPTVPLVNENYISLTAKRVGNYQYHPFAGPLVDQMWVR